MEGDQRSGWGEQASPSRGSNLVDTLTPRDGDLRLELLRSFPTPDRLSPQRDVTNPWSSQRARALTAFSPLLVLSSVLTPCKSFGSIGTST